MARPTQDNVDLYMSITGVSEATAVQKLEEHDGDLNRAVNAHFGEGEVTRYNQQLLHHPDDDLMEVDDPIDNEYSVSAQIAASQDRNPFSVLNTDYPERIFNGGGHTSHGPEVAQRRETRETSTGSRDNKSRAESSVQGLVVEEHIDHLGSHGPDIYGAVKIDDGDDRILNLLQRCDANVPSEVLSPKTYEPGDHKVDVSDYNETEEEMIRAAIEASRRDNESLQNQHSHVSNEAVQNSMQGHEEVVPDEGFQAKSSLQSLTAVAGTSRQPIDLGETSEDVEEKPLVRRRSRRNSRNARPVASGQADDDDHPPTGRRTHHVESNGDYFPSDEWGGLSSVEHDEAVMLEAAMFGGIPEENRYLPFRYPHVGGSGVSSSYSIAPRPPSPGLTEQRLLREQQDDEYLAALQADQEKELKAMQEAELRRAAEDATRKAALEKQRQQEEEIRKKQMEEEELDRKLAAKAASLPLEPSADEESSVTLLIRMPDGTRYGRRFLKSDKLQCLFDFIDIGRAVKPETYRLVRPYPRQAFTCNECDRSLGELGLTSKQEALFLELV